MAKRKQPRCPECGTVMGKDGHGWSGRKRVQNYTCSACGRSSRKPKWR